MKTAIILHGTLGSPDGNWFQWLEKDLEARGFKVWLPQLPHAEQPSLKEWLKFVQKKCPFLINQDTLIIGHSSGAILALILAQNNFEPMAVSSLCLCFMIIHSIGSLIIGFLISPLNGVSFVLMPGSSCLFTQTTTLMCR